MKLPHSAIVSCIRSICVAVGLLLVPHAGLAQAPWRTLSDARSQNALWMASATTGWLVGDNGLIRQTTDGGATWSIQASGTTATLRAVWGYSAVDVWAVGDGGTLLYWDGTEWFDHSMNAVNDNLLAIHGSDFDDVWVVGEEGAVLHWDGTNWKRTTPSVATGTHLRGVWAASATLAWAVGDLGLIMKWNGSAWSDVSLATQANLQCITGLSATAAWIGGANGTLLKWNGTTWAATSSTGTTQTIRGLSVLDATHLWAVAENGVIRFSNGSAWSAQAAGGTTETFCAVKAITASNVIATGNRGMNAKYNGTAWSVQTAQAPNVRLNGVWALDSDDVWMVGGNGTAARYHDNAISFTSTNVFDDLFGVAGIVGGTAWAVGANGVIIKWDGNAWAAESSGVTETLFGVWAQSDSNAWAVGQAGTIVHWNGTLWQTVASGTTRDLNAVWGASANAIWAVGKNGTILKWNGTKWTTQTSGTGVELFDVWGTSSSSIYAVGAAGTIRKFNGTAWSAQSSGVQVDLHGIGGSSAADVWAVGADVIRKSAGSTWSAGGANPAATALLGVTSTSRDSAFAVGWGGTAFTNLPTDVPQISVEKPSGNRLVSNGSATDFGALAVGSATPTVATFTLRNTGTADLENLAITITSSASTDYTPSGLSVTTLAPGETTTVDVSFLPTENGVRDATLEITSNDIDTATFLVPLTGTGLVPTEITTPPSSLAVDPGDPATFNVVATGSDPLTYQWRKDTTPIDGATESSYTILAAEEGDEGSYDCVINSPFGTEVTSDPATLSVNDPVAIVTPLAPRAVVSGSSVTLDLTISGSEPITYQWRRNNVAIKGATSGSYTIPSVALANAGTYSVIISNSVNKLTSEGALLTVVDASPKTLLLPAGTASTSITITSSAAVASYTWGKDGGALPSDFRYTGWTGRTLNIKRLQTSDTGSITCTVDVPGGPVTTSTSLVVYGNAPEITLTGAMPDALIGSTYGFSIPVEGSDDKKPTKFAASNLPPGLVLNTATGEITGRPTVVLTSDRSYAVTLFAINGLGTAKVNTTLLVRALATGIVGNFAGPIARNDGLNNNLGGVITVTTTGSGSCSGKLCLGAVAYSFSGTLNSDPHGVNLAKGTAVIRRSGSLTPITIGFDVDPSINQLVDGEVSDGTNSTTFTAWRNKWGATTVPSEIADLRSYLGYYTFGIELGSGAPTDGSVPEGIGYGSFSVATNGTLTVSGKLSDGTAYTSSSFCGPVGEVLVYQALYSGKGSVLGTLDISQGSSSATPPFGDNTLAGTATWLRPAIAGRTYAAGFEPANLDVAGGRYVAPTSPKIVMALPETGSNNASIAFGPTSITTQITPGIDLRIRSTATVMLPAINPRGTKLTITANSGFFSGSFKLEDQNPAAPGSNALRTGSYAGIITRSGTGSKGVGYFLLPELPAASTSQTVRTTKILSGPVELIAK